MEEMTEYKYSTFTSIRWVDGKQKKVIVGRYNK